MSIGLQHRLYAAKAKEREAPNVVVAGWVKTIRPVGKLSFIILRDRSGTIQLTFKPETPNFEGIKDLTLESVIAVKGDVVKGKVKSGDNELVVKEWELISKAEVPLPIDVWGNTETALDKRLDFRFMDLRSDKVASIFRVRSTINTAIRETLLKRHGFIEMQTPKIAGAGAEGGAELFKFKFYDKEAYLSQSQQLYKQMMMAAGFDRVFEIGPSFRAEKSHTKRHLAEFTHFDFEMAFIDNEEQILQILEDLFVEVSRRVKEECAAECALLNVNINVPQKPFPRIAHKEAIEMLDATGSKLKQGDDIGSEDERKLGALVKNKYGTDVYFLTEFPYDLKPFYIKKKGSATSGFDFEFMGEEIASGGQREHRYDVLVKQIKEKGLKPEQFEFYLTPFRFGMPSHAGFGLGIDRLTKLILGLDAVQEAVLFPRTPERLVP